MRIGYFGGSFDPPHRGHLAVARAASATFHLDNVLFVPAGRQPLKPEGAAASFRDRLAMTALLCDGQPTFSASDLEAPKPDHAPSYTIETLRRLHSQIPAAEVFVLVGADAFLTVREWREPSELLRCAQWIVVSRPDVPLERRLPELALTAEQLAHVHALTGIEEPASATEIRRLLLGCAAPQACEAQISEMVPPAVLAYILEHGLYR
jgi:nicotinate-nucleotide adenylyltransferase